MAESSIQVGPYRDLEGRGRNAWVRRAVLALLAVLPLLALLSVFGQKTHRSEATAPSAALTLSSPTHLRGGLLYQAKINVVARTRLAQPKLVLDRGFLDGMTVNTIEPQASQELNRDGRLVLEYDAIAAGEQLTVWIQYQVNPTTVGARTQRLELDDEQRPVTTITRHVTVLP
ncbi:MAG TPA: hypothetical protein VGI67_01385 [Thermoleophilaceae bacterium]|jgi:hypothetical protein